MSLNIALVTMPFAAATFPSIALTQLRSVLHREFGDRLSTRIVYLNHEFVPLVGADSYDFVATGQAAHVTAFGEWLFRQVAFPELPDNTPQYLRRYAHHFGTEFLGELQDVYLPLRAKMPALFDALIRKYRLDEADVVGLTSMFQQNLASFALARRLKLARPDQTIVMGGSNCEGTMGVEIINNVEAIDFVFSGHSLLSFPEFVRSLLERRPEGCHKVSGVFSRKNSRSVDAVIDSKATADWGAWPVSNQLAGVRAMAPELDVNTPVDLDYDEFFESLERAIPGASSRRLGNVLFETSRGCWWGERAHCTFCGLNGQTMSYRAMHPDLALTLVNGLIERYGDRAQRLFSVDNILPLEYFDGLFRRLETPEHLRLFYEVKADLEEEQVRVLAKARVLEIQPGIESLATSTLKLMRKGTTAFHNVRLLQYCKRFGVSPTWNLLVGFPGECAETYERYVEVLPSLFHLPPPTGVFSVRFDRFSPYFTQARRYNLALAPYDHYELCYPFSKRSLMNMAYYFQDCNVDAQYANDAAKWMIPMTNTVSRWQGAWRNRDAPPRLGYRQVGEREVIEDARGGEERTHRLSDAELTLLRSSARPVREEAIDVKGQHATNRLRTLRLVFEERGRLMSLV